MQREYQNYIDNLIRVQELLRPHFEKGTEPADMIEGIRVNARRLHGLCQTNDRLLNEILFARSFQELDEQDVRELQDFADRLFAKGESLDTGIAHYIHRFLLNYAKEKQDRDLCVRELYHAGVTLLHVSPIVLHGRARNPFSEQIAEYFAEGASYAEQYEDSSDEDIRFYIRSCQNRVKETEYQYIFPAGGRMEAAERKRLLNDILTYHPPTYVHSLMVAWLSEEICRQMIRTAPDILVGTMELADAAAVRRSEELLCSCAGHGGLYHDLGKSRILNYIGLYGRRLLDEEFACVKMHPILGSILLKGVGCGEMAHIALHHHQWADGSAGYPYPCEECPAGLRQIVDIVSVADSLDAATDDIGRSYASAKSYRQLVDELREAAGTRYSADVVKIFEDEEFCGRLERELGPRRQNIYCDVYR